MKIAYIGIDLFLPALEALLAEGCEVTELFTCRTDNLTEFNTGITALAERRGIPYTMERITAADFARLQADGCEMAVSAGYYYKIPVVPGVPTVNIHPSLLPYGRGGWPMPLDILECRRTSGVTVHKIAEGFDTGDILLQREFSLDARETLQTFMQKVYALLPEMLHELVTDFSTLYTNARPQGEGVYLPMPDKALYTFTPQTPFEQTDRLLRAFYGYDCYYRDGTDEYRLIGASASHEPEQGKACFPVAGGFAVCDRQGVTKMK